LSYHTPGHPESPDRVGRTALRLESAGLKPRLPPRAAREEDVLLVHQDSHFPAVRDGDYEDPDTPHYPGIETIALKSLSGALSAAEAAVTGRPGFSLMRPPGHHAGRRRVAGFCYFNNLAIACASLQKRSPDARIGILDIDVHHGDGTEDIVRGKDAVIFASLHQSPLYPGTGLSSEDNCLNFPLPPGTGETAYLKTLDSALRAVLDFRPTVLAVSAGFDTYKECPIAGLRLERATYRRIGSLLGQTGLNRFAVLEGGYAAELPILVENFLTGFFAP
jgi:acetoin utilization deacetylase AcuC-like enzyme